MNVTFLKSATNKPTGLKIAAGVKATGKFIQVDVVGQSFKKDMIEVTIPEGTEVSPGVVLSEPKVFKTAHMSFFFKVPTMKTLEKWSNDSVAKSVTGKRCEPDGHGEDGSPSWLLALGMI
jgi:hypothetical protein